MVTMPSCPGFVGWDLCEGKRARERASKEECERARERERGSESEVESVSEWERERYTHKGEVVWLIPRSRKRERREHARERELARERERASKKGERESARK